VAQVIIKFKDNCVDPQTVRRVGVPEEHLEELARRILETHLAVRKVQGRQMPDQAHCILTAEIIEFTAMGDGSEKLNVRLPGGKSDASEDTHKRSHKKRPVSKQAG